MMRTEAAEWSRPWSSPAVAAATAAASIRRHFHARAGVTARRLAGRTADRAVRATRAAVTERAPAPVVRKRVIAKFHYTDTDTSPTRPLTRTFFAAKLRWVRMGSVRVRVRVRVVEFSYK